ncbi:fatty acid amide hydrolase [Selaginella moellendorffii]|uniref:fatty acid amide hydrolase n=1 Tax=Selaginella moellendorffii TaxID=88036 RepID=UPI000D1CE202|nr:fatty acid amide hydrolase [Selaginella moellendorffii]|eukprot:XP_024518242.1 fatty acid amide hydrolase [Selaginella moellendorffii]
MGVKKSMLPVEEVLKGAIEYVPLRVGAPRSSGMPLRIFAWVVESQLIGKVVLAYFMRLNRLPQMLCDTAIPDSPMFLPEYPDDTIGEPATKVLASDLGAISRVDAAIECLPSYISRSQRLGDGYPFKFWCIRDYAGAYRSGRTTPMEVAERFIQAVEDSERLSPPMAYMISFDASDIRKQAAASAERFASGSPLSMLDGVLIVVKDDIDCLPHESRGGTQWLHKYREVKTDAACVARLRECGVIFAGKTNMHELGMGTTGNNPYSGTARNPYDTTRYAGGSSSGSAAVVASGLCPASLGTDAGGSIRIPSGLCGLVGLKCTFGRITLSGLVPVGWTLEAVGPIAANVEDALIVYSAMIGSGPSDVVYSKPPPPCLPLFNHTSFQQLKLGIYTDWFTDVSPPEVATICRMAVDRFCERYSSRINEIAIPELEELRNGHLVTTGSEICTCLNSIYKYGRKSTCHETRVIIALFKQFQSSLYVSAQRLRRRLMFYHMEIFRTVDVIVTPTTGVTAPFIPADAISTGETDLATHADLMRFIVSANFLGLPAVSVPVGHDKQGLPVGLQLIGKPWQEATLLRIAFAIEELCAKARRKPAVFYDML